MKLEVARRLAEDDRTWETVVVEEDAGGSFNGGTITDPLVIETDETGGPALQVIAPVGATQAIFWVQAPNGGYPLTVTQDGSVWMEGDPVSGATLTVQAKGDGIGDQYVLEMRYFNSLIGVITDLGQIIMTPNTMDPAAPLLQLCDDNTDPVFEVRNDGSVHIKTGTSIIADL